MGNGHPTFKEGNPYNGYINPTIVSIRVVTQIVTNNKLCSSWWVSNPLNNISQIGSVP